MSGLVAKEIPDKIDVFRRVHARSFGLFTGFLWSICGPFSVGPQQARINFSYREFESHSLRQQH